MVVGPFPEFVARGPGFIKAAWSPGTVDELLQKLGYTLGIIVNGHEGTDAASDLIRWHQTEIDQAKLQQCHSRVQMYFE